MFKKHGSPKKQYAKKKICQLEGVLTGQNKEQIFNIFISIY
jgi:hypothetical protein